MTDEVVLYPKETINVFNLKGKFLYSENKSKFYNEIRKEWKKKRKVTRQTHTVRLFLLNSHGGIYFAKRSKLKKENALLYDKTIGAHIRAEEPHSYTVLRECGEELGFPAAVLDETEFVTALDETDLNMVGVFKEIETLNRFMAHYSYKDGKKSVFPQVTTIYIGVFDGPLKFRDGETSGIEVYYLDEITEEIKKHPDKWTEDVKVLIPKYLPIMKKIIDLCKHRHVNTPNPS